VIGGGLAPVDKGPAQSLCLRVDGGERTGHLGKMTTTRIPFRISTHLKDVIGRDLVTNEFVAIFELVKNSFDAGANLIQIEIDPAADEIRIVDDGKGMTVKDITEKWLFVAYSAKADGTEDKDYRNKIKPLGSYAGSKGIGRFSCDTLGKKLKLYSRAKKSPVVGIKVLWEEFEKDSKKEFKEVRVEINDSADFPAATKVVMPRTTGTILQIGGLRHVWDKENIQKLRKYLAKLIDPFETNRSINVVTFFVGSDYDDPDLNGPVGNNIADVLSEKTTRIDVTIEGNEIATELVDRGKLIYRISEPNPYEQLQRCKIRGEVFFLNQSAKNTFTQRMKVRPVEFGSVFLFLNRFRVFPIGEEMDDSFGLNRRKQQGSSRYFGTRDLLGRVDVTAPSMMFRESSNREGLIEDANSRALFEAIRRQMIFRLERYVVGVNWQDKSDQNRETPVGLENDPARSRILQIVGGLARSKDVRILDFAKDILELAEAKDAATERAFSDLIAIAEREGDVELLKRVEQTRARIAELEEAEEEARQEANRLALARVQSDARISKLERQSKFLAASQNMDAERVQLLLHQVDIYAGHIAASTAQGLSVARKALETLAMADDLEPSDFADLAGSIRSSLRTLLDEFSYIRLQNHRLQTVSRFAPNIKVDVETSRIHGNIIDYLKEYFLVMLDSSEQVPKVHFTTEVESLESEFSPFDIAVIVDNLIDNARKAGAQNIWFEAKSVSVKTKLELKVHDDGQGLDIDKFERGRIFEKHYSGTRGGTGLGLFHVSQVLGDMGGSIRFDAKSAPTRADFILTIPGVST
jgi:signal transduction histidine kinase